MIKFQIGKNGITENVIETLNNSFKNNKVVRISVLKNSVRDKLKVKEIAEMLSSRLKGIFAYRIIGFTIVMRRKGQK